MKRLVSKITVVVLILSLMPVVAFGKNNNKVDENSDVKVEKINDTGMTDDELEELEANFDEAVAASKERKSQGYDGAKISIPDNVLKEDKGISLKASSTGDDVNEIEPNDRLRDADRIYVNDYVNGTIEDRDDVDYYKIKFSTSGQAYIRLTVPDDVDYEVYLMGSSGTQIEEGTDGVNGETERLYAYVTPKIYYYIRVEGAGKYDYDKNEQYQLKVKLYDDEDEYALCIGAEYNGVNINTADDAINAYNIFDSIGYISQLNITPYYDYLDGKNPDGSDRLGSSVVFLDGHGSPEYVRFDTESLHGTNNRVYNTGVSTKYEDPDLNNYDATFVPIKNKDVSTARLMIFAACETAGEPDSGYNITKYAVKRGAETAIGWEEAVGEEAMTKWMNRFLNKLEDGYTVEDSALFADEYFNSSSTITKWVIEGNEANVVNLKGAYSAKSLKAKSLAALSDYASNETVTVDLKSNNLSNLENYICEKYSYFNPDDYQVTVEPINGETSRVYYEKFINGFNSNSGFYVIIKNGEVEYLKEKPLVNEQNLDINIKVTNDMIEEAKNLAAKEVPNEYKIIEQKVQKMIIDSKYCLVVESTYAVDYGTSIEAHGCQEYIYEI